MARRTITKSVGVRGGLGLSLALLALPALGAEVVVFAASSLKGPLDAIAAEFQAATGQKVVISYGGSNALARQILQGAPADIYLSAAPQWMDEVDRAGLLAPGSRRDLLGNSLVLVAHGAAAPPVPLGPDLDIQRVLAGEKLSMADVTSVPAGQYGKAALDHFGLWTAAEPHVVQSENVRTALAYVTQGEAAFGVVYATDALAEPGVSIVAHFPATSHPPILYPVALLSGADAVDTAFFQALSGASADGIFAAAGFRVLE